MVLEKKKKEKEDGKMQAARFAAAHEKLKNKSKKFEKKNIVGRYIYIYICA